MKIICKGADTIFTFVSPRYLLVEERWRRMYIKKNGSSSLREDKFELYGFFVSLTGERFQPQAD